MNYSAFKPPVHAFDLDFLPKFSDTKTTDKRSTFLHFFARALKSSLPTVCNGIFADLSAVEAASKLPLATIQQKCSSLATGFNQLKEQIKLARNSTLRNDQVPLQTKKAQFFMLKKS